MSKSMTFAEEFPEFFAMCGGCEEGREYAQMQPTDCVLRWHSVWLTDSRRGPLPPDLIECMTRHGRDFVRWNAARRLPLTPEQIERLRNDDEDAVRQVIARRFPLTTPEPAT
jgi:hypothetical protein